MTFHHYLTGTQDMTNTQESRTCADCGLTKPRDSFGTRTVRGKPYPESSCRPCKVVRTRQWRKRQKEKAL